MQYVKYLTTAPVFKKLIFMKNASFIYGFKGLRWSNKLGRNVTDQNRYLAAVIKALL